eukprot:jgi/Tetstr1/441918/TSEL_030125.t1
MAHDDEVGLKLSVVWEGRLMGKSVLDFNRQWLETHTLHELLEHAVAGFESRLVPRADANICIMRGWLPMALQMDAKNSDIFICGMQPLDEDHPHHASFLSDYRMTYAIPVEIE